MKAIVGKIGLAVLLVALVLAIAACVGAGGSGGSETQKGNGSSGNAQKDSQDGGMHGNDHSNNMDHGSMGGDRMAWQMLKGEDGEYSDERFVDVMVPHHQGAVEMAEVALENAEHEEILRLSRDIVRTQEAEIMELKDIKREESGTAEIPMGMSDEEIRGMGMMRDPQRLAEADSFDKAFIDNMIPHHQSAIGMANVALEESENPRIRELAEAIVEAQEREIAQMERWRQQWYPEG